MGGESTREDETTSDTEKAGKEKGSSAGKAPSFHG